MADKSWHKVVALPWAMLTGIPVTLFAGLVIADYWQWFIAPTFIVPPITYLQAVGIMLFVGLFKIGLARDDIHKDEDHPVAAIFIKQVLMVVLWLLLWGFGAVWSLFI